MIQVASRCLSCRSGTNSIEYALIGALISIVIVGGLLILGPAVNSSLAAVAAAFP